MVRLLIRTLFAILANTIGLLMASAVLDKFTINGVSFVVAVVLFTLTSVILSPLITKIALKNAKYLMGGIALISTLVSLMITVLISDGISISGVTTWIAATVIIWIFSVFANVVLPLLLFKNALDKDDKS